MGRISPAPPPYGRSRDVLARPSGDDGAAAVMTALRLRLLANGYRPVPVSGPAMRVRSAGKRPLLKDWHRSCAVADEAEVRRWATVEPGCTNTGLLCGALVGVDIDVPVLELAARIEALAAAMLGATPLRRLGRAPKALLCYRAAVPMRKAETPELLLPDGTKVQVEVLGDGQQFVAHGVHPDTRQPYAWPQGAPEAVALAELPEATEPALRAFLAAAEGVLRAAGGLTAAERQAAPAAAPTAAAEAATPGPRGELPAGAGGGDFFREVNRRALADIAPWFCALFPRARREAGTGAWRVASHDLGRGLEEDLSMHPTKGGHDFGTREGCSPIDVVMRWNGAPTAQAAAVFLCEKLRVDPAELGWRKPRTRPGKGAGTGPDRAPPPPAEDDGAELVTEDAAATAFAREYGDSLRFCHHAGAWYQWTSAIWRREETRLAFSWTRQVARRLAGAAGSDKAVIAAGRASFAAGVERFAQADRAFAVTSAAWDPDPWLLGTPGGTVDLRTGALTVARRESHITKATAVAPADEATCPTWLAFLAQATGGDEALVGFLRRWFGYCLTGITREHALLFLFGPGGNGKGVLLNTVAGILGTYATTAAMDAFTVSHGDKHSTDLAMLHGARLVMTTETEEGRAWAEARIKALTGGDPITARFMRRDNFTFTPAFKLTISGNHKPALRNVDDAARRRFNLVPFLHKPERPDPTLPERLRREWPGILRWMVDGCLEWQQLGLVPPPSVKDATADYFAAQDVFGAWVAERCILDPNLAERPGTLLSDLNAWAEQNGAAQTNRNRFRGWAERQPGLRYKAVKGVDYVAGIGLRAEQGGDGW
jgi:P4 family phage/plasmid primase-like protien